MVVDWVGGLVVVIVGLLFRLIDKVSNMVG